MDNDIPKKVIDITGVELTPESLPHVLATERMILSAAAMHATIICFVFPNLI